MQSTVLRPVSAAAALVLVLIPRPDGVILLTLEQALLIFFVAAMICIGRRIRPRYAITERGPIPLLAVAAIFGQEILGAAVHGGGVAVLAHAAGALVVIGLTVWTCVQILFRDFQVSELRRCALWMLSLTFSQLLLGMGTLMNRAGAAAPQPDGRLAWFGTAHAICGSLLLGASVITAVLVYSRMRPEDAELAHGGVAIA